MFEYRASQLELLDTDPSERLARQSYRFMAIVNRFFGGTRIARNFIAQQVALRRSPDPLRILDIGSGSCDIPVAIARWAHRKNFNIEFTCIETNPCAITLAQKRLVANPNLKITLVQQNIFQYKPAARFDCAMGSLFFHHLSDIEILKLMTHLRTLGPGQVLINDLHRSRKCYLLCKLIAALSPADVRHDALLSIRRAFQPHELRRILSKVPNSTITVDTNAFCRVSAIVGFFSEVRP